MNGTQRKVPSRQNMDTTVDGYLSLKKNGLFDNQAHKLNFNYDLGYLERDH